MRITKEPNIAAIAQENFTFEESERAVVAAQSILAVKPKLTIRDLAAVSETIGVPASDLSRVLITAYIDE